MASEIPTRQIQDFLSERQGEMVDLLRELVIAESPSTDPESQRRPFRILSQVLEGLHYSIKLLPGKQSGGILTARPTQSAIDQSQLLLGHCDTVWPVGTLEQMPVQLVDGRLSGPGVYDMKAGLTQMVYALQTLNELKLTPKLAPVVLINSDEETGSLDSRSHIRRFACQSCRVYVLEPSLGPTGKLKTARKGVGEFTITIRGKAAHAGLEPETGASAILELSFVIQKLHDLHNPGRGLTINVGMVRGGQRVNIVAPECRAQVDVRATTRREAKRIEELILGLRPVTQGVTLHIDGAMDRPPMEKTPRNRSLWELAREMAARMNLTLEEGSSGGASDGNFTSETTATLDGLGAVGDGAHAPHEFIYVDKLLERTALLVHLLLAPPP